MGGNLVALLASADDQLDVPMNYEVAVSQFNVRCHDVVDEVSNSSTVVAVVSPVQPPVSRIMLSRKAKTVAVEKIRKTILEAPIGGYRIPGIADLHVV